MVRRSLYRLSLAAVALALAGTVSAADETTKRPVVPRSFYQKFFSPRIASSLDGEVAAAAVFVDPAANPWTRDSHTVGRIEKSAISATTGALKQYVIQGLQLDTWSVTILGGRGRGNGSGMGTMQTGSAGATRLRFGISHLTPRADVSIPASHGNVGFSIDARGRLSTSFDSHASNFRTEFSFDPTNHTGSFSLTRRF